MSTTLTLRGLRASHTTFPRSSIFSQQRFYSEQKPEDKVVARQDGKHVETVQSSTSDTTTLIHEKPRNNRVNPPASTLPPPLVLPEKEEGASNIKHMIKTGKTYGKFYWAGVKAVYKNLQLVHEPQKLVDLEYKGAVYEAVKDRRLSRADYQLLLRNWHDVKRIPLFGLVVLVCGEFTPFVVPFIGGVVPYTCRIPSQIEGERRKLEERRRISFRNLTTKYEKEKELDRQQLLHITWSLGLSGRVWDYIGGKLPGLPDFILRSKVAKRVEYIETDDRLLRRDGRVEDLDVEEVKMACEDRGIDILNRDDEELREHLQLWLNISKKEGVTKMLLTR